MESDDQVLHAVEARLPSGTLECSSGWWPIVAKLDRDIAELVPDYSLLQVKEKFGGLRYYVALPAGAPEEEIHRLIAAAETTAGFTCEFCGEPGRSRNTGWIKTLCDAHASTGVSR